MQSGFGRFVRIQGYTEFGYFPFLMRIYFYLVETIRSFIPGHGSCHLLAFCLLCYILRKWSIQRWIVQIRSVHSGFGFRTRANLNPDSSFKFRPKFGKNEFSKIWNYVHLGFGYSTRTNWDLDPSFKFRLKFRKNGFSKTLLSSGSNLFFFPKRNSLARVSQETFVKSLVAFQLTKLALLPYHPK